MKTPQLSKSDWINYTEDGVRYRTLEHDAWMAMYYATRGWHKTFCGGLGSYPETPIKWDKLVQRAHENNDYMVSLPGRTSVDVAALLAVAKPIYEEWEKAKTYGQYVKEWHASGKTLMPKMHWLFDGMWMPWEIKAHKIAEDETWYTLLVDGVQYSVPKGSHAA